MIKGRVVIDFQADKIGECSWNLSQDGDSKLTNEELVTLFESVIIDLFPDYLILDFIIFKFLKNILFNFRIYKG